MPITARNEQKKTYEPVPEGMHEAVCYAVYDLGSHWNERYGYMQHKVLVIWEIPGIRIEFEKDGEQKNLPKAVSKRYTLSMSNKGHLRKDLESWRGKSFSEEEAKAFDVSKMLGVCCQLQIMHNTYNEKIYSNVNAVLPHPKGPKAITAENTHQYFSLEDNTDVPDYTPEWIAKIINDSHEIKERMADEALKNGQVPESESMEPEDFGMGESDIPF